MLLVRNVAASALVLAFLLNVLSCSKSWYVCKEETRQKNNVQSAKSLSRLETGGHT